MNGSKLKINWVLPRVELSGGVKSNRLIAEAMVRRGHEVCIAYLAGQEPWPHPWRVRRFTRRAIAAWRTRGKPAHHLVTSTARLVCVEGPRIEARHLPDADVTVATWWETAEWIRDWPESKGLKAHFIRHYETFGGDPARIDEVYRLPTHKLVIARWLQRLMSERFGDHDTTLVPNGVDWTQFDSTPRSKAVQPTVGLVYSSLRWKGCETAFEAIRIARKTLPNLHVIAFGSLPIKKTFDAPADIEYHLRPAQTCIADIYRKADCWLLSSTSEGFGMPGIEASACRTPVVSTRCGGPEDYIDDGVNGHLVDVGDAEAMADRLLRVVTVSDENWRKMSEAAYAVARKFNWDRSAELLEQSLLNACGAALAR